MICRFRLTSYLVRSVHSVSLGKAVLLLLHTCRKRADALTPRQTIFFSRPFLTIPPPCTPTKQTLCLYTMSRGGRGGFRGGRDGGMGGAMQLVSFDLLKDLGSDTLFNVQTALFPVCSSLASFKK